MAVPRILATATALLLLAGAAACGDDGSEAAEPATVTSTTTSTTTGPTTTTEPADPWAVPDEIDEAYVQRVLTKLYEIEGDARRHIVDEGTLTEEAVELLHRVYSATEANLGVESLADWVLADFPGVVRPPGDVAVTVEALRAWTTTCALAEAVLDYSAVNDAADGRVPVYISIASNGSNETGWAITSVRSDLDAIPSDSTCAAA